MLLKYFNFLLVGLFLMVSGCIQVFPCESKFSIDKLPNAIINQPYLQEIEISGGAMASEDNINWEITPKNSGINIKRTIDKGSVLYGGVEISGIPKFQGNITIRLYGSGSPPPRCTFDRVLILKITAPTEQAIKD